MIESDQDTGRRLGAAAMGAVWVALLAGACLNYLCFRRDLGRWQLPVALAFATINLALLAWFFMLLAEHRGARRMALPVGILYLLLLLGLTMLDVTTRYPPARPGVVELRPREPPPATPFAGGATPQPP